MPVDYRNAQRKVPVDSQRLKHAAAFLLDSQSLSDRTLSVLITKDKEIQQLHADWMGDDTPTDVLSFQMESEFADGQQLLGDIVISAETAARQKPEDPMGEMMKLLVHGFLHLLGMDHVDAEERREMNAKTRQLLKAIAHDAC